MGMFRKLVAIQALSGTAASVLALVIAGAVTTAAAAQAVAPGADTDQTSTSSNPTETTPNLPAPGEATSGSSKNASDIIVTGSHIRHDDDNFRNSEPITVIGHDINVADGARSIADLLQAGSVTSGTSQINGAFLGFISQDGQAANTVGLRGLGAQRTLVLLNGRRLAPSGVGPQLEAADLNVLPDALIDHIDILRQGASSVYGSDAIAGVINIVTDNKFTGIRIDGYLNTPLDTGGGGDTKHLSIAVGKEFAKGHITASFEYRDSAGLRLADRSDFQCPRYLIFDPTSGAEVGPLNTNTGKLACFPYSLGNGAGFASGYNLAYNLNNGFQENRFTYLNGDINNLGSVNGINRVPPNPIQELATVIAPTRTYTGYLNGSYELDVLGDAEIYGEALFTRRQSSEDTTNQLSFTGSQLSSYPIQIYNGLYNGQPLPASPFYPSSIANLGYGELLPLIGLDHTTRETQRVDFLRANGGLRGNLPFGDWHYDANFQYSRTWSMDSLPNILTANLANVLEPVPAPAGTPAAEITYATPGEVGAGNAYTCAGNLDGGGAFIAGSTCAPLNIYSPSVLLGGHVPANINNYLYVQNVDRTKYLESIAAFNVDGTLFKLPAGAVKASLGYEHRYESLVDTPSSYSQEGLLYGYSSGGITQGSDSINEVYGELAIPFFKDRPWLRDLEANLSGRYTHYASAGSAFTYHAKAVWQPTSILLFRGNYGTSFRGPNLYELYLAHQTGFYGGGVDPCSDYTSTYAANTPGFNNCQAQLTQILGSVAKAQSFIDNYGPTVTTEGGLGHIKPERSTSWGFGTTLNLPLAKAQLSLAVDYFNVTVRDEVEQLGNLVLNRCYEATDFPNNPYCSLIQPRFTSGPYAGALVSFDNPYLNVALQKASGVDFDLQFSTPLGGGNFAARVQATRNIHQDFQLFNTDPIVDYNGTLGQQGDGGGPKWVGNLDANYLFAHGRISVHYNMKYVGPQSSTDSLGSTYDAPFLGTVDTIFAVGSYFEHGFSVQFKVDKVSQFTIGCSNCTDSHPPQVSVTPITDGEVTRIGNYFNSSNYDYYGRSIYVNFTYKMF